MIPARPARSPTMLVAPNHGNGRGNGHGHNHDLFKHGQGNNFATMAELLPFSQAARFSMGLPFFSFVSYFDHCIVLELKILMESEIPCASLLR